MSSSDSQYSTADADGRRPVYRAWQSLGDVNPALMAGHSLGEYTAFVASGALAFSDAL